MNNLSYLHTTGFRGMNVNMISYQLFFIVMISLLVTQIFAIYNITIFQLPNVEKMNGKIHNKLIPKIPFFISFF